MPYFIAVNLERYADKLRDVKLLPIPDMEPAKHHHLTLHFFDENDPRKIASLRTYHFRSREFKQGPFDITLDHVIGMPDAFDPALFAIKPFHETPIRELRANLEKYLGMQFHQPYVPHVTLARKAKVDGKTKTFETLYCPNDITVTIDNITLYESSHGMGAQTHHKIATIALR